LHEYSTAVGIVETITKVAKENKATRIKKVELVVGDFSMLNTEQLKFAFEIAAEGTLAEKADLIIEGQQGEIDCKECGFNGPVVAKRKDVDHFVVDLVNIFECPKCKSNNTKISGGRDIFVKNIEVELGTE